MDLLVHLATFAAVARERSFSRAADELGIAQPLLSRRIRTLEDHLGGELFDRSRRQIEITDLGALLLPHARDLLARSDHLLDVARTARASTVLALGVPPDADPRALAQVIRASADRGLTVSVREVAAAERAAALASGALALALVRVPPDAAALTVPLGLASAGPPGDAPVRPVHLDDLRPRRPADARTGPRILVTGEDDVPLLTESLHRRAARAGLPEHRVRLTSSTASALAETLAGDGLLLCVERFARREQLSWAPLADPALRRGYELAGSPRRRLGTSVTELRAWLTPLLGAAVGAAPARARTDPDGPALLASGS